MADHAQHDDLPHITTGEWLHRRNRQYLRLWKRAHFVPAPLPHRKPPPGWNRAKRPMLWSRLPQHLQPPKHVGPRAVIDYSNRRRQVRSLVRIDQRTTLGRLEKEFRTELLKHIKVKNGSSANAVERALVEQCVALRLKLAFLDEKVITGKETEMDANRYIAWSNAFRRSLAALNYGEAARIIRQTAEARLLKEYSR